MQRTAIRRKMKKIERLETTKWKVVPLSKGQLLDVSPQDILYKGHFRKCNTYKGGGGYDRFPTIAERNFKESYHHLQFIVQLWGCNLDCPYCYVTRAGIWSTPVSYTSKELVDIFEKTDCSVFHLMGGAPALTMNNWPGLINTLRKRSRKSWIFHSDLMLSEGRYNEDVLRKINDSRALYAVNIKGITPKEYELNTRRPFNESLMWENISFLERQKIRYYLTFTNVTKINQATFWTKYSDYFGNKLCAARKIDAFEVNLIQYNALSIKG